jgi:hypothetical protein
MEETLSALIMSQRFLEFYSKPSYDSERCASKPGSKEGNKWARIYKVNQMLSGIPYTETLTYTVPDKLNPVIKHRCTVSNQLGYRQDGGSCPIFSIKSLVDSVLGHELTTLHLHFMQQANAVGYLKKLENRMAFLDRKIDRLSSLVIEGRRDDIALCLVNFKKFLTQDGNCPDLFISSSFKAGQGKIVLSTPHLKQRWSEFLKDRHEVQEAVNKAEYPGRFFNKSKNPSNPNACINSIESPPPGFK